MGKPEQSFPPASEMRKIADDKKDVMLQQEINNICSKIKLASSIGRHHMHIPYVSDQSQELLKEKGYTIDFDLTYDQPSYKISW